MSIFKIPGLLRLSNLLYPGHLDSGIGYPSMFSFPRPIHNVRWKKNVQDLFKNNVNFSTGIDTVTTNLKRNDFRRNCLSRIMEVKMWRFTSLKTYGEMSTCLLLYQVKKTIWLLSNKTVQFDRFIIRKRVQFMWTKEVCSCISCEKLLFIIYKC